MVEKVETCMIIFHYFNSNHEIWLVLISVVLENK